MGMLERALFLAAIAVTSALAVGCDTSHAAPRPVDAAVIDAAIVDAAVVDAAVVDAAVIDAAVIDAAVIDAPPIDGDLLFDSQEAPPLHDAGLLPRRRPPR
jgi:hypothetical protein